MFRQALEEILLLLDDYLLATRDQQRYRCKGKEERVIITRVGEVRFKRRYYLDLETGEHVYLLERN